MCPTWRCSREQRNGQTTAKLNSVTEIHPSIWLVPFPNSSFSDNGKPKIVFVHCPVALHRDLRLFCTTWHAFPEWSVLLLSAGCILVGGQMALTSGYVSRGFDFEREHTNRRVFGLSEYSYPG